MRVRRTPTGVNGAFVLLCACAVIVLAFGGDLGRVIALTTTSAATAATIAIVRLRPRSARSTAWWLAFVAFCVFTFTSALSLVFVHVCDAAAPPSPLTDTSRAVGYLILLTAALVVISPTAKRDMGGVLDSTTAGVAAALTLWLIFLDPALDKVGAKTPARVYTLVAIVLLSALSGAMLRAVRTSKDARPALAYFLVAVLVTLCASVLAVTAADARTGAAPTWAIGLGVFAFISAWAASAHPASDMINAGTEEATRSVLSRPRIALLGMALGIGPFVGATREIIGAPVSWLALSIAELILVTLVLTRVAQLAGSLRDAAAQLDRLANHDALTGLANRRAVDLFLQDLTNRVGEGRAPGVVLLFVDLNGFKAVNDDHGHHVGDELLTAVADRLAASVRRSTSDLAGRLGGDEFVLIVEGDPLEVSESAKARVLACFVAPFDVSSGPIHMSASIGMASAPRGTKVTVDTLLTHADHAMYQDKRVGPSADDAPAVT